MVAKYKWPDTPFAKEIETTDPYEYCALSVTHLGTRLGNNTESYHVLLAIHDRIAAFEAQPEGSAPESFSLVVVDILLEMVPEKDLTLELAIGALKVLDVLVYYRHARNIRALIACNGVTYGALGIDFIYEKAVAGSASSSLSTSPALNVTAAR